MIDLNITFFLQVINFLVSLFIINFFIISPIRTVLHKRNMEEDSLRCDIASLEENVQKLQQQFHTGILSAREEADTLKKSVYNETMLSSEALLKKTKNDVEQKSQILHQTLIKEKQAIKEVLMQSRECYVERILAKVVGK